MGATANVLEVTVEPVDIWITINGELGQDLLLPVPVIYSSFDKSKLHYVLLHMYIQKCTIIINRMQSNNSFEIMASVYYVAEIPTPAHSLLVQRSSASGVHTNTSPVIQASSLDC